MSEVKLEFTSDHERMYFAQARLGEETIQFLNSSVGRYLHGCAKQEVEELRDELEKCNPSNPFSRRKIRRLQRKADAARYFVRWCSEAIEQGELAFQQLEGQN